MYYIPTATKITQKGQVTVPKQIREYLGLSSGNRVKFAVEKDKVVIRPMVSLESSFGRVKPKNRPENFSDIRKKMQKKMAKEIVKEF